VKPGGRGRWFAKKTICGQGHKHDSKAEAGRCADLHIMQQSGLITRLQVHPTYYFGLNGIPVKHDNGRRVSYTPDFDYFEGDAHVVEDVKGRRISPDWPIRRAFFRAFYPYIDLRVVKV
jgi:hypothetical protein